MRGRRLAAMTASAVLVCAFLGASGLASGREPSGREPSASKSATASVSIREFSFRPSTKTVDRGTTVVFTNRDPVRHTATRGGSFDTGPIKPGKSKSVRFSSKGTYRFHCKIHPEMRGKIVVD